MADLTPFQTAGPFLSLGLVPSCGNIAGAEGGRPIAIEGTLRDGAGHGIPDGVLEFWHPSCAAVGRVLTDADGGFRLEASKPPGVAGPDGVEQAPHFAVHVLGRGILTQCTTRVYFDDEPQTSFDPVLALVPAARRGTLVARRTSESEYRFDVVVQGEHETVFFDV